MHSQPVTLHEGQQDVLRSQGRAAGVRGWDGAAFATGAPTEDMPLGTPRASRPWHAEGLLPGQRTPKQPSRSPLPASWTEQGSGRACIRAHAQTQPA